METSKVERPPNAHKKFNALGPMGILGYPGYAPQVLGPFAENEKI
jgi:hypothetical protein